jgi:alpha-glucosidase
MGAMEDVHTHGMLLHFTRRFGDEHVHCAFNLGDHAIATPVRAAN